MIVKLGIILAAPFLLMGAVLGTTGVILVDVREGGPEGMHLAIPVPLLVAQGALAFAPGEAKYIECAAFARYQKLAEKVLLELKDIPDCTLVEVVEKNSSVRIEKQGGVLLVNVRDGDLEQVECRIPIRGAIQAVRAYDGRGFPAKAALAALKRAPRGVVVHVTDGEDEVTIRRL